MRKYDSFNTSLVLRGAIISSRYWPLELEVGLRSARAGNGRANQPRARTRIRAPEPRRTLYAMSSLQRATLQAVAGGREACILVAHDGKRGRLGWREFVLSVEDWAVRK